MATCAGCQRESASQSRPAAALHGAAAGRNVLLITLDTTRADRLGCYGYQPAATPVLDGIAQGGVRFDRAFAHAPMTLPSHASLLSGTLPPENGVHVNGEQAIAPELTTLGTVFKQRGYQTAAFLASIVLDAEYGLAKGFDVYDDAIVSRPNEPEAQRPAGQISDLALPWLERHADGKTPFFCWVHYFDPHTPYNAPDEFVRRTQNEYDAEVAYMDAEIGRLIRLLDERALLDQTLIVVVGDHGESLGEHGFPWHSLLLYHSIVRVPLIFALPGVLPQGAEVGEIARMSDVMPTILDLLGWPVPPEVSGESLAPALAGEKLPARPVYAETDYPLESFGWSPLQSLIDGDWKYIRAPAPELYDLSSDAGELDNLMAAQPERAARMEAALAEIEAKLVRREAGEVDLAAAQLARLRSLGYVGGGEAGDGEEDELKNPVDLVDVYVAFRHGEEFLYAKDADRAIEAFEPLLERSPESYVIVAQLAAAYAGAGMLECAQGVVHEALAMRPDSTGPLLLLARLYEARGGAGRAVEACRRVLEIDPEHEEARDLLPALQQADERQQQRLAKLRERFRSEPEAVDTCLSLTAALLGAEQTAEALGVLRAGIARNPEEARLAIELAWHLATSRDERLRDGAEAVRLARRACRGDSEREPEFLNTLSAALAEAGKFEEAAETARRASELARQAGHRAWSRVIARRVRLYEAQRPYRSPR